MTEETPAIGHNSATKLAAEQLLSVVQRIERLEEQKQEIVDDIKDVYSEAKGTGYDTRALRTIIRLRKMDPAQRAEQEAVLDLYKQSLGML